MRRLILPAPSDPELAHIHPEVDAAAAAVRERAGAASDEIRDRFSAG